MFGVRRYRIFLLIASFSAAVLFYLSQRGSWDVVDIERLGQSHPNHNPKPDSVTEHPDLKPSPPPPPPPPPPPLPLPRPPPIPTEEFEEAVGAPPAENGLRPASTSSTSIVTSTTATSKWKPTQYQPSEADIAPSKPSLDDSFIEGGSGRWEVDPSVDDGMKPRWRKPMTHFPIAAEEIIALPSTPSRNLPKIQASFEPEAPTTRKDRIIKLNTIKESFKHAWKGYTKYASPHDELKPISKDHADPFMGWGATLVDSLDTLWIMGLKSEFADALVIVEKIDFQTSLRKDIPLFETVIRYLGGLLAAYDVSGARYPVLLTKAEDLAVILMGAFDTPNHMPMTFYNWRPSYTSQPHRASAHATMAELGSLSVEFTRLAQITKRQEYYDAIARITDELEKWQQRTLMPGLWPLKLDASGCKKTEHSDSDIDVDDDDDDDDTKPTLLDSKVYDDDVEEPAVVPFGMSPRYAVDSRTGTARRPPVDGSTNQGMTPPLRKIDQEILSVDCVAQGLAPEPHAKSQVFGIGGQADSTYEYFPKMHALLRGRTKQYESMYTHSMEAIRNDLLFRPMIKDEKRKILFASKHEFNPKAKVAHKKHKITHEVTHLSCFIGGMFGLGAKLFGVEGDLELAKQLTDGCVWAYESMPTGIMAEQAAVVPCLSMSPCAWNETRWHEALDPDLEERLAAVEAWNKNQRKIFESSRKEALTASSVDEADSKHGRVTDKAQAKPEPKFNRRETKDDESREPSKVQDSALESLELDYDHNEISPTRTTDQGYFDEDDAVIDDDEEDALDSVHFVPKTALSHKKYVEARIQEERLPPSYTRIVDRYYSLRPEAIESVFYMYRLTGDEIWRQKGWKMFEVVQSATQTEIANAAMMDVTSHLGDLEDTMESFWLAETLKYFYLLFDEPDHISLDDYVLNTEAHPLRIPK